MANYNAVINGWQNHGPSSGFSREDYEKALAERDAANNAASSNPEKDKWDAERAEAERQQAEIAKQQTIMRNSNALSTSNQLDNSAFLNTGGTVQAAARLQFSEETTKRKRTGAAVLGL